MKSIVWMALALVVVLAGVGVMIDAVDDAQLNRAEPAEGAIEDQSK